MELDKIVPQEQAPGRSEEGLGVSPGVIGGPTRDHTVEEALRVSEDRFRAAFDHSTVGRSLTAPDGRLVRVNRAFCDMLGYSEEELSAKTFMAVTHPDDLAPSRDNVRRALAGEIDTFRLVKRYIRKDGAVISADVTTALLRDSSGRPVHFITDVQDITDRLHAEHALRESEERFRSIFELCADMVCIADIDGRFLLVNPAFERTLGYSVEELLSRPYMEFIHPDDMEKTHRVIDEKLKRGEVVLSFENRYISKDGRTVWLDWTSQPLLAKGQTFAIARDVSERVRLANLERLELEEENKRVLEANRLKSEFLANMSHELRTPLNAIIGFTELLQDGIAGDVTEQQKDYLGDVLASSGHLLTLINDILDLAKVEAGKMEFVPEPVQPMDLAREVVVIVRELAAKKRILLDLAVDPDLGELFVDSGRLKQVLYNLLSNAIKFTDEGGSVDLRISPCGPDRFRVEVEDTGIGIRAEDLGRLFGEFQQLDVGPAKRHAGTGLGLALTKRIVEAQGGYVGVQSQWQSGSRFFAVLPRTAAASAVQGVTSGAPLLLPRPGALTVLVVEDDPRDREWLIRTLTTNGYGVQAAATGAEALALARAHTFDAVTLDLLLPDITGLEVLRQVRAAEKHENVPVIVVTVVADKGIALGFPIQDLLFKPVAEADLLEALERAGLRSQDAPSVLVIDDDPQALKLAGAALASAGYATRCIDDAAAALEAAQAEPPGIIILDLLMPGMTGFEFLERFRQTDAGRSVPVVVWSASELSPVERGRLLEAAQGIVSKTDGGTSDLLRQIAACLARARSDQG